MAIWCVFLVSVPIAFRLTYYRPFFLVISYRLWRMQFHLNKSLGSMPVVRTPRARPSRKKTEKIAMRNATGHYLLHANTLFTGYCSLNIFDIGWNWIDLIKHSCVCVCASGWAVGACVACLVDSFIIIFRLPPIRLGGSNASDMLHTLFIFISIFRFFFFFFYSFNSIRCQCRFDLVSEMRSHSAIGS